MSPPFFIFVHMEGKVMSKSYLLTALLLAAGLSFASCTKVSMPSQDVSGEYSSETKVDTESSAPTVVSEIESMYLVGTGKTFSINLDEHFADPEGGELSYAVRMSSKGLVDLKISGNILEGKTYNFGRTDITVTANNAAGFGTDLPFAVLCTKEEVPASVYPNPVKPDAEGHYYLNVCSGKEAETDIRIYNQSGSLAWSNVLLSSVFKPAIVDMTDFASGKYNVVIRISGEIYTYSIIKL